MEVMLPLINLKNYAAFVGQAAGQLTTKGLKSLPENVTVPAYFSLKDQVPTIPPVARQNVSDLVDSLESALIANDGPKMFAQLLRRLESNRPNECRKLVDCLNGDPAVFDTWRKDYKGNLMASSQLLQWISKNGPPKGNFLSFLEMYRNLYFKTIPISFVDRNAFQNLLLHFRTVNESFTPGKTPSEALKNCTRLCDALISDQSSGKKQSRSGGKMKFLNDLLLIALVSLVWYDIRVHGQGSFNQSRLGGAMKRHGVTDKATELYQRAQPYLDQARPYWDKARDHALNLK